MNKGHHLRPFCAGAVAVGLLALGTARAATICPPRWADEAPTELQLPLVSAPDLAADLPVNSLVRLSPARESATAELAAIGAWNRQAPAALRTGFERRVATPPRFALQPEPFAVQRRTALIRLPQGDWGWRGQLTVDEANALRVHLRLAGATAGVRFFARSQSELDETLAWEPVALDDDAAPSEGWSGILSGPTVELLVVAPPMQPLTKPLQVTVDRVVELVALDRFGQPQFGSSLSLAQRSFACEVDLACVSGSPELALASRAVGRLDVVSGGFAFSCSGGLVASADPGDRNPYFLTARHCVSSAAEALSVLVVWDYKRASCDGSEPALKKLRKSHGATLLTPPTSTDVALLQLKGIPKGRAFLGWTTEDPASETLRRVSHPAGGPQAYSETTVVGTAPSCSEVSVDDFLFQTPRLGATFEGSSGSPVWIKNNLVVGQLSDACGGDTCSGAREAIDGRFSVSYGVVQPWLDPAAGPPVPRNLRASTIGKTRVVLRWSAGGPELVRYELTARRKGFDEVDLGALDPTSSSVEVTGLLGGKKYQFWLKACRDGGCSKPARLGVTTH